MDTLRIPTALNVDLAFAPAGLGERIAAWFIDACVLTAYAVVAIFAISLTGGGTALGVVLSLPFVLYHFVFEAFFDGRSPGKRARGLRVARLDGGAPTTGQYALRWLLRWVDVTGTSGLAAVVSVVVTRRGQRLGDLAAGTTVLRASRRVDLVDVQYPRLPPGYVLRFPQAARLSDADVRTLRAVLLRVRQEDDPVAALALARRAQAAVEERLGLGRTGLAPADFVSTIVDDYTAAHDRFDA